MTTTWEETKTRLAPRYSVTNERYETTYSIPLGQEGDSGAVELSFRLAGPSERRARHNGRPGLEFSFALTGNGGEAAVLGKEDIVTLQRVLTSVLEHSRVRRFEWLAERESSVPSEA